MKAARIAVVRGDGIANEVMPEAEETLRAAAGAASFPVAFEYFDWGSERYLREGRGMPEDGCETLRGFDAVFQGAIGDPRVPGSIVQEPERPARTLGSSRMLPEGPPRLRRRRC